MDNINKRYSQEKLAVKLFEASGWDIKIDDGKSGKYTPDLTLRYKNEICGYVELISHLTQETLVMKLVQIRKFFKDNKPKVFVITDMVNYYIYNDEKIYNLFRVPTPSEVGVEIEGGETNND